MQLDAEQGSYYLRARAVLRRGRGYADHHYLILKVQRATFQIRRERERKAA
jgi:hypothetical protein